jgi:glycosyltransferase involved in cell wall biosynthesis
MPDPPLVFIHAYAPPTPGGTPVIVHRLLAGPPPLRVETFTDIYVRRWSQERVRRLPGRYRYFVKLPPWGARWRAGRIAGAAINYVLALLAGARAATAARRDGAAWVLSVADNGFSVIAGDVCARLSGLPHLIWIFDLWEENAYTDVERWVAHRLEPGIWRRATALIAHTEAMSDHYEAKHGVRCRVLPTPIELGGQPAPAPARNGDGPREVLFAGALYWAQEETLRRLARVCAQLDGVSLTVVGEESRYRDKGIQADRYEPSLPPERFRERLERADLLFLGLSFDSDHPDVIATATPARLPEFMASGRPIVVHAPAGAHVTEYARREDFAEVVDSSDDAALAAGIRRVLEDEGLSTMRARRAQALAAERHDAVHVRGQLRALLAETMPNRPSDPHTTP